MASVAAGSSEQALSAGLTVAVATPHIYGFIRKTLSTVRDPTIVGLAIIFGGNLCAGADGRRAPQVITVRKP
ncbi:MAG: hypothetical protein H6724_11420 [Sandaracinus sp.]|nr:hypothetical protein [Sandaracinus sp.]